MKNFYDLSKVNILITGSSGLLGSTYCKYFLKQGAHVIGLDKNVNYKKFNLTSSEKRNFSLFECDITSEQQIKDLFKKNYKKFNKLTVLINNASYLKQISSKNESNFYKDFLKSSKSDWGRFYCS
jgi:Dehydrogenases with different specificities (related to short-chain alcohol dehydrogenases)